MTKTQLKALVKKAIAIVGPKQRKIFGMNVISYGGVPKEELWILTKDKFYKLTHKSKEYEERKAN